MTYIREEVEHNIWWQTRQRALYFVEGENAIEEELEVKDFVTTRNWDETKLLTKLSQKITDYILESIKPH
ncbi:hypothetical protein H5410_057213 [Solanum commersonii]|uniref:Uncharacterized protein n=1 Tax=Solanum commersonii TaxID=4109 RepID=A0A9J5WPF7_SOLCO|nr:hypothetical protein H5410_057213 [Solanum commersonii]